MQMCFNLECPFRYLVRKLFVKITYFRGIVFEPFQCENGWKDCRFWSENRLPCRLDTYTKNVRDPQVIDKFYNCVICCCNFVILSNYITAAVN